MLCLECLSVSKLDLKSSKCFFLGYTRVQRGTHVIVPLLDDTSMLFFLRLPHFPFLLLILVRGKMIIGLFCFLTDSYPNSSFKPHIPQVYSWNRNPPISNPTMVASHDRDLHQLDIKMHFYIDIFRRKFA